MAPLRVPGTGRRSQAAPSHLNTNLGPLSYHTQYDKNPDWRCGTGGIGACCVDPGPMDEAL